MRILVTGGAGYVGSVTTRVLLEAGHEVWVLDNLSHGNRDAVPDSARFIEGGIADIAQLISKTDQVEAVMHFASFIAAGESMTNPEKYWHNNTVDSLKMLDGLRELGITKLIFSSTAAVYGNPSEVPITEDAAKNPTNTYGMTKLALDMAISSECIAHGLAATSLRYFNVAGAYQDAGERHPVESHIIPLAFDVATGKKPAFTIFGTDYDTPDGTCVRDYIHVYDLARAHLLALDKLTEGVHGIYNLGNGIGFSNKQVLETVKSVTNTNFSVLTAARREGDPATLVASSRRAEQELGWVPEYPELETIVLHAWDFYRTN